MFYKHLRSLNKILLVLACVITVSACSEQMQPEVLPTVLATVTTGSPSTTPTTQAAATLLLPTETAVPPTPTSSPSETPAPPPAVQTGEALQGEDLIAALQQGGFVIYFRHAETDPSQTDTSTADFKDCSTQRNLNAAGRASARAIGEAFMSLNIPVDEVLSSAYCRTRETALLAFGTVKNHPDLTGFPTNLTQERIAALQKLLSQAPAPDTNTVLVAHGFNISGTAGITISEGEAAIFAPGGADGFRLVARVLPTEWGEFEQLWANLGGEGFLDDPNLLLPDLIALPPEDLLILSNDETGVKQLRFTTIIENGGAGNIEVWGYSDPTSEKTIVVQHIGMLEVAEKRVVVGEFVFHPEHDHWHLGNFARYEVWTLGEDDVLETRVAVTEKVSYCLRDDERAESATTNRPQTFTGCNHQRQGIAPGWVDIYKFDLPGQVVDISELPDGVYVLLNMVDPDQLLWELDRENNTSALFIEITGNKVSVLE